MRPIHLALTIVATAVLASLLTIALAPRPTSAQPSPDQHVAIAQGPQGMWVVYGGKVVICHQYAPEITGQPPPAPRCGTPARLP